MNNNLFLIQLVIKRWKLYSIISAIALTCSIVFSSSWFITPLYKSYAIIYPSNLQPYSTESPSEQMLQFFQSVDIKNEIIKKFDLVHHYEIDSTQRFFQSKLYNEFDNNISIKKTPYESIEIEVMDKDPIMAYEITRGLIDVFNEKIQNTQKLKAYEVMVMRENIVNSFRKNLDSLFTNLQTLSIDYNILEYEAQVREAYRGYFSANSTNRPYLDKLIKNLEEKGGEFKFLSIQLENTALAYSEAQTEYEVARADYLKELTYTNEVSTPFPSDKKAYPTRWLIVLVVMAGTWIMLTMLLILQDQFKKVRND